MPQPNNDRTRNFREDTNPPGSGLSVIANQFSRPSKDDDEKSRFANTFHNFRRLIRDPQAIVITFVFGLMVIMSCRFYVLSMDDSIQAPTARFNFRANISAEMDPRATALDNGYFRDYYVFPGKYYEEVDPSKGVDLEYINKNTKLSIKAQGTFSASRMHGKYGFHDDGTPSWEVTPLEREQTLEDLEASWKGYAFNSVLANSIPLDRDVPDVRPFGCKVQSEWKQELFPSASVGIVFHNENLAVLLRSVVSILNRTPPHLLREIILVDDDSELDSHPELGAELDDIIATYPKVRLRRMSERQGLMMARIRAGEWARGDVVVFLDSHIEVTNEWLEPLLQTIMTNPKTIVVPKIVSINGEDLNFEGGGIGAITFSWSLGQEHLNDSSTVDNFTSPAMAGGLFAANNKFFMEELGGYDTELKLYGGEEFELGFKTWMCGGRIEVVPCSRIGHIFRKDTYWKGQVYKVPGTEIARNKRRVAHVWMDEYAKVALGVISNLPPELTIGDMTREKRIRDTCLDGGPSKSFDWYLKNIATTVWTPSLDDLGYFGAFANLGQNFCIDSLASTDKFGGYQCHYSGGTQTWLLTSSGEFMSASSKFDSCAVPKMSADRGIMKMENCTKGPGPWIRHIVDPETVNARSLTKNSNQLKVWGKDIDEDAIFNIQKGDQCLTLSMEKPGGDMAPTGVSLEIQDCDLNNTFQLWAVVKNTTEE